MSATERLAKLGDRLDKVVSLRHDPVDAKRGHEEIRVDVGTGAWVVAVEWFVPPSEGPPGRRVREVDALGAGRTVREAVSNAERAVDRRLAEAEHRARADEAERRARGDAP